MPTVNVKVNFEIAKYLDKFVSDRDKSRIGETVVKMSLESISKGISPVRGIGKFEPYKGANKSKAISDAAKEATAVAKGRGDKKQAQKVRADKAEMISRIYPWSAMEEYPNKKATPVNLELSGDMLRRFDFRIKQGNSIDVGILSASREIYTRARAHNDGEGKMPFRPFIPDKPGQEFTVSIQRAIKEIFSEAVAAAIKVSNEKRGVA